MCVTREVLALQNKTNTSARQIYKRATNWSTWLKRRFLRAPGTGHTHHSHHRQLTAAPLLSSPLVFLFFWTQLLLLFNNGFPLPHIFCLPVALTCFGASSVLVSHSPIINDFFWVFLLKFSKEIYKQLSPWISLPWHKNPLQVQTAKVREARSNSTFLSTQTHLFKRDWRLWTIF